MTEDSPAEQVRYDVLVGENARLRAELEATRRELTELKKPADTRPKTFSEEMPAAVAPEEPLMLPANRIDDMREAGYEVVQRLYDYEDLFGDPDLPEDDPAVRAWQPHRPDGDGWKLHIKGFIGDDGDFGAIWYRAAAPAPGAEGGS